jgi:hypothetical protein
MRFSIQGLSVTITVVSPSAIADPYLRRPSTEYVMWSREHGLRTVMKLSNRRGLPRLVQTKTAIGCWRQAAVGQKGQGFDSLVGPTRGREQLACREVSETGKVASNVHLAGALACQCRRPAAPPGSHRPGKRTGSPKEYGVEDGTSPCVAGRLDQRLHTEVLPMPVTKTRIN